ncbi:MAG: M48 family metallopeptidase [Candidatus ainarchaeum sp.]|nr:M48 family metallopeptidase [Candidatus ainarchaeum sp.]
MDFYNEISSNNRMTFFLFLLFFALLFAIGYVISFMLGSYIYVPIFGFIAIAYALVSYYASDSIVTAISGAKPVADESKFETLHHVVEEIAIASGLPKPRVFVIEDTAINAFATGRNPKHAVICVTTGCLTRLNRAQLTGVVAHEMSHIRNSDIKVMTIAAILVGVTVLLSDLLLRMFLFGGVKGNSDNKEGNLVFIAMIAVGLILAVLTPLIAQLINFAISRKREYLADASAAQLTRYPEGLASALEVISGDKEILEAANKATAHLYIANPLRGQKLWMQNMFDTHPPIADRIAKLRAM